MATINTQFKPNIPYLFEISYSPNDSTDRPEIRNINITNSLNVTDTDLIGHIENAYIGNGNTIPSGTFTLTYTGSQRTFTSNINFVIDGITDYENGLNVPPIICNGTLQLDPVEIHNPNENEVTVHIKQTNSSAPLLMIKYKYGNNDWNTFIKTEVTQGNDVSIKSFTIPANQSLYICSLEDDDITDINIDKERTTLRTWCYQYSNLYFSCDNNVNNLSISGDIMSLIDANNMAYQCFRGLFNNFTALKTVDEDFLSPKTLSRECYYGMFEGCTSLTDAPNLPALTMGQECYRYMFSGCTSLEEAPLLEATSIASSCCWGMFKGCTSLTTAPQLPATSLAEYCYYEMFSGCTSLEDAPELPATTLARSCYMYMFTGCSALTTTTPIILGASELHQECYRSMFSNCNNVTSIRMEATTAWWDPHDSGMIMADWLSGTATSGRGTLYITSTLNTLRQDCINDYGYDPIDHPNNWDVVVYN